MAKAQTLLCVFFVSVMPIRFVWADDSVSDDSGELKVPFELVTDKQYRKLFGESPDPKFNINRGLTDDEVADIKRRQEEAWQDEIATNEDNPPDVRNFGFTGNETQDPDLLDPRGIAFDLEVIRRAESRFPGFPNVEKPKTFSCTYEGGKAALRRQAMRAQIRRERQQELASWERMVVEVTAGNATNEVVEFFWSYERKILAEVKQILKDGRVADARRIYRRLQDKVKSCDGDAEMLISRAKAGPVSAELSKRTRAVIEGVPDGKIVVRTKGGKVALDRYLLDGIPAGEYHSRVRISIEGTPSTDSSKCHY